MSSSNIIFLILSFFKIWFKIIDIFLNILILYNMGKFDENKMKNKFLKMKKNKQHKYVCKMILLKNESIFLFLLEIINNENDELEFNKFMKMVFLNNQWIYEMLFEINEKLFNKIYEKYQKKINFSLIEYTFFFNKC